MSEKGKGKFYLKEIELSGYKSIHSLKSSFVSGLNIVIGKNASGKTNLLSFLNMMLTTSFKGLHDFNSKLIFKEKESVEIELEKVRFRPAFSDPEEPRNYFSSTERKYIKKEGFRDELDVSLHEKLEFQSVFVYYGVPSNYLLVDEPIKFKISRGVVFDLIDVILDSDTSYFVKSLLAEITSSLYNKEFDQEKIKTEIFKAEEMLEGVSVALRKMSPVSNIRLNKDFEVYPVQNSRSYEVKNLHLEFCVNGKWYPFSSLSDGTKRLFYVISEVSLDASFSFHSNSFSVSNKVTKKVILLEEPELGVHPHQLHNLMLFLKEQADTNNKQIIITTHSPQTLDILSSDELDNILIADIDEKEGTQLSHLSEDQKKKAQAYMEEDYLSDYWKYSDLEPRN